MSSWGANGRRRPSRGLQSALIAAAIVLIGLGVSALVASTWRANQQSANHKSFEATVADLDSTLAAQLSGSRGYTSALAAIATMEPGAGETRFLSWYAVLTRHLKAPVPGLAAGVIERVPASGLAAFRAHAESDPAYRALIGGKFQIVPAGRRAVYCLTRATVGGSAARGDYPVLLDYCAPVLPGFGANPFAGLMRTATDTGSAIVLPVSGDGSLELDAVAIATYRRGAPLSTVAERRAAVTGFIATTFNGDALIDSLLVRHPSLTMVLYHTNSGGRSQLISRGGAMKTGRSPGYLERSSLGQGWFVLTSGTVDHPLSPNVQGLVVAGVGVLITLLALLLYVALSRSRQRAWSLVGEKTDELAYVALHDPLTGLPNRRLALDRAQQILARGRRLDSPVTALFIDVDAFKKINDRFGHQAGDDVLREVGARLAEAVRDSDTVGRLGGDEFVMLIDAVGRPGPRLMAERVLDSLRAPIELTADGLPPISITASIGIATGLPASAEALLADADLAMYQAKAAGPGGYVVFESAMQAAAHDRLEIEMALSQALAAGQLSVLYLPVLELESGRVVGAEALLRWRHPTLGEVAPEVFIPVAQESGLIVDIGRWVLAQACAECAGWHQRGYPLGVSVNVSAEQFDGAEFVDDVRAALAGSGLEPASLTLDIAESVLMRRPAATEQLLIALKALGVMIAVDDFGTWYASFGYLRQFPIDVLKIDRSFIGAIATSDQADELTRALIHFGKTLGLETLAEGVEHQSQVAALQREGCDLAQGFVFAQPLTPEELEVYLHHGTGSAGGFAARPAQPAGGRR